MKRAIQLNNILFKAFVIVSIFYLATSVIRSCVAVAKFESATTDSNAAPPEQVLAVRDGLENTPQTVQPYAQLLDQLQTKCTENRLQIAGIAATITKKGREDGMEISFKEGLETLLYEANITDEKHSVSCMNVYLNRTL